MAANNQLLPAAGSAVVAETSAEGVEFHYAMQGVRAQALLTRDLRLKQVNAEGDATDRMETSFVLRPNGLVVSSLSGGRGWQIRTR